MAPKTSGRVDAQQFRPSGARGERRPAPGDEAAPGTPGTGEDVCPKCAGTGEIDGDDCPDCEGTGVIVEGIGGG